MATEATATHSEHDDRTELSALPRPKRLTWSQRHCRPADTYLPRQRSGHHVGPRMWPIGTHTNLPRNRPGSSQWEAAEMRLFQNLLEGLPALGKPAEPVDAPAGGGPGARGSRRQQGQRATRRQAEGGAPGP